MTVCQELLNYKKITIFARDFCSVFRGLYWSGFLGARENAATEKENDYFRYQLIL